MDFLAEAGVVMGEAPERLGGPSGAGTSATPELSIIILTYDRHLLLRQCLDSLLAQTLAPERMEILVANDGSTDGTSDLVEEYCRAHPHVRHVRHEHRGIPATRNLGIRHARGGLVAIVADDYILDPSYAKTIVQFFAARPEAAVVRFAVVASRRDFASRISHVYYQGSILQRLALGTGGAGERPRSLWQRSEPRREITTRHGLDASGGAAFRREVFERVGLFDETLARGEDTDLTIRLRRGGIAVHYDPLHAIRHQYDPYLRDTLVKCWLTGWHGYHHYRKNGPLGGPRLSKSRPLRGKAVAVLASFRQARAERSTAWFFVALPFTLLFEAANKTGFVCSWLWTSTRSLLSSARFQLRQ